MFSLPVVTWIGNAATVLSGRWGAISRHAQEIGCSREAMYQQARRVEQAVAWEQAGGPSREESSPRTSAYTTTIGRCGRC